MPRLPLTLAFFKLETIDEGRRCAWRDVIPHREPDKFPAIKRTGPTEVDPIFVDQG